jgi:hypothetical protein
MIKTEMKAILTITALVYACIMVFVLAETVDMYKAVSHDVTDNSAWDSLYMQRDAHLQVELLHKDLRNGDGAIQSQTWLKPIDQRRIDSVFQIVKENQNVIVRKQDDLIDSIRQETNNNLDKLNLWLTFWIGVISFFGVVFPIVSQIFLYKSYKDELSEIVRKNKIQRLSSLVNGLHIGIDNRLLVGDIGSVRFCQKSWKQIVEILEEVTNECKEKECITAKDVEDVALCFFYIRSFLKRRPLLNCNMRYVDDLTHRISKISNFIMEENDISSETFKLIREIIGKLSTLQLF